MYIFFLKYLTYLFKKKNKQYNLNNKELIKKYLMDYYGIILCRYIFC